MSRRHPALAAIQSLCLAIGGGATLWLLAACSTGAGRSPTAAPPSVHAAHPAGSLVLAQLGYGADAHFSFCPTPGCAEPTPKTLASGSDRSPSAQPIDPDPAAEVPGHPMPPTSVPVTAEPRLPVSGDPVAPDESPARVVTVHFAPGLSTLTADAQDSLIAAMAGMRDAQRITVTGRTDSTGPATANDRIAMARATAVRDFLRSRFPRVSEVLVVDTQGRCCYLVTNATAQGRRSNRRVEVRISLRAPSTSGATP